MVALYPAIPHEDGLETLRERLVKSEDLKVPVNDIVKMTEFILKNNSIIAIIYSQEFEFNGKVKQQVAGWEISNW